MPAAVAAFAVAARGVLRDAARICRDLFAVMIPILIAVKIVKELGWIDALAKPLAPLMDLFGLPPQCALTMATGMANNLYAAMAVQAELAPSMPPLSVAQATVLATMMLFSHNLFVEGAIAGQCGAGFGGQVLLRFGAGLVGGGILHAVFSGFSLFTAPAPFLLASARPEAGLAAWALDETRNLALIACVITALVALMRALTALGANRVFEAVLQPFFRLMGIGRSAATITVIGLVMGLAYGGGLIRLEVTKGGISRRDVLAAVSLMSLSHALIEDTLLMCLIGASLWGTFVGRLLFSLAVVAVLTRCLPGSPEGFRTGGQRGTADGDVHA